MLVSKKNIKPRYLRCYTNYLYMYKEKSDTNAVEAIALDSRKLFFFS